MNKAPKCKECKKPVYSGEYCSVCIKEMIEIWLNEDIKPIPKKPKVTP